MEFSAFENRAYFTGKGQWSFHFLLECNLYNDLRVQYIKRYYWNRPNILKLKELMSTTNKKTIRNLSIYIEKAFKIRYGQ